MESQGLYSELHHNNVWYFVEFGVLLMCVGTHVKVLIWKLHDSMWEELFPILHLNQGESNSRQQA